MFERTYQATHPDMMECVSNLGSGASDHVDRDIFAGAGWWTR